MISWRFHRRFWCFCEAKCLWSCSSVPHVSFRHGLARACGVRRAFARSCTAHAHPIRSCLRKSLGTTIFQLEWHAQAQAQAHAVCRPKMSIPNEALQKVCAPVQASRCFSLIRSSSSFKKLSKRLLSRNNKSVSSKRRWLQSSVKAGCLS